MSRDKFKGNPGYDTLTDEEWAEIRAREKHQREIAATGSVMESDAGTYDVTKLLAEIDRLKHLETAAPLHDTKEKE
jgi:hypothetical protein